MADNNDRIHVDTDRARAGATPGMTRYILGASMILIIIVFAILFMR